MANLKDKTGSKLLLPPVCARKRMCEVRIEMLTSGANTLSACLGDPYIHYE